MLVSERDLEVKYLFAVTLKAEMSRLDDSRVHWAYGDLVHLFSLDTIEVHDTDRRLIETA